MEARYRSWWQQIKQHRVAFGVGAIVFVVVIVIIIIGYQLDWTGFKGKTVWDWLQLLGVLAIPVVVGFGAAWFTAQQGKVSDRENTDNQRETALQRYIDKISELLLHEKLRDSGEEDEVRNVARVRTLTVLLRLDANRKRIVLQFLYESGLIKKDESIIDLRTAHLRAADLDRVTPRGAYLSGANLGGADLSGADLNGAFLREADLSGADLSGADLQEADLGAVKLCAANLSGANLWEIDLSGTDLRRANFRKADLSGADLNGAFLREADLRGANLIGTDLRGTNLSAADLSGADLSEATATIEQLDEAKSLKGVTIPDGSIHE